ncbi:hypothetical protein ASF69_04385 [Rhizobium sp. Leaf311]|nr:hypothetical protein ASF69_04385 [Rhizobium sp. Leaf311]
MDIDLMASGAMSISGSQMQMAQEILRLRTLLSEADQRGKDARRAPDGWCLVPKELTPEIIQNLQMNTEIGAYVCENLSGAYALMDKYHLALVEASKRTLQSEER